MLRRKAKMVRAEYAIRASREPSLVIAQFCGKTVERRGQKRPDKREWHSHASICLIELLFLCAAIPPCSDVVFLFYGLHEQQSQLVADLK